MNRVSVRPIGVRRMVAAFAVILAGVAFVSELVLSPLSLVEIQRELSLSLFEASWFLNTYALAVAISVLIVGLLGLQYSMNALFAFGVLLFCIGSVGVVLAGNMSMLLNARAAQGIGGGVLSPLIPILLARMFPTNTGRALMIWGGLAGIVVTLLPPIVAGSEDWRHPFWSIAVMSAVSFVVFVTFGSGRYIQRRIAKASWAQVGSARVAWKLLLYIFLTYGCFTYCIYFYSTRIEGAEAPVSVSVVVAIVWCSFSVFSFVIGARLSDQIQGAILSSAPLFIGIGFATAVMLNGSTVGTVLSSVLLGVGLACSNAPSTDLLLKATPRELRPLASSFDITAARLGGAFSVAVFAEAPPTVAVIAVACCSVLALLTCRWALVDPSGRRAQVP